MTAKYSTDQDDARRWESDNRYVLAAWSNKPFVDINHRYETVEHRIVIEYTHEVGVDIQHEIRSEDSDRVADEWTAVETIEVREYGARHTRHKTAGWLQ